MLDIQKPIKIIKDLKIPFFYEPVNKHPPLFYHKNYNCTLPFNVKKKGIVETILTSSSNIIIEHQREWLWCPLFDEMYKKPNTPTTRFKLHNSLEIRLITPYYRVRFKYNGKIFETTDVILLKINKEKQNENN